VKSFKPLLALTLALVWSSTSLAAPAPKEKEKEHDGKKIDSGSFGVYQNGHRVGTETFSVYETGGGSVVESEFKTENAPVEAVQSSVMQLNSNGEVRRYEWKELSPGKAESVVMPNDDFLMQKWRADPQDKQHEKPYLLPTSTSILDDYFFVHREILAWKFLGMVCKQNQGQLQCQPKQHTQFGTMNPHQQSSAPVSAEFIGREKVTLKTGPTDLLKLEFSNDAGTWQIWLDDHDQFKVQRMTVIGDNTEVIRD
jgi:hypothetical protein